MHNLVVSALLTTAITSAYAEPLNYNVINIQADASRQIANDEMTAVLYLEKGSKQPAELANQININMNQALAIAKKYPQVKIKTGSQTTEPVYDDTSQKLKEWRAHAEIQLMSKDFKAESQLIAELQQNFKTDSVQFSVSQEQRRIIENELIIEASKNFQDRAQTIAHSWQKSGYELINLNIDRNNNYSGYALGFTMAKARTNGIAAVSQDVSGGESKITVNANGSIQLK